MKRAITGHGHAAKAQIQEMVRRLLTLPAPFRQDAPPMPWAWLSPDALSAPRLRASAPKCDFAAHERAARRGGGAVKRGVWV